MRYISVSVPGTERKMKSTEIKNTMGARIKERREAQGMTQEQLAEELCTKKSTISAYENDKIDIKSSIILELAAALNCSASYLLEGSREMEIDNRLLEVFAKLQNEQMKEVALRQLEALLMISQ